MGSTIAGHTDFKADAVLDADIHFKHSVSGNSAKPEAILLTGATGFFGAYLLEELLRKTEADIHCLIRCKGDAALGKKRIEEHLRFYALWKEEFAFRIIPVPGDLSQPMLGLTQQQFCELGERTDVIYHNGAWINSVYPYSELKKTNVSGTQEILRFAGCTKTKPVHFVSTIAVFFTESFNERKILETDMPNPDAGLKGGYKQSKCVAEHLVKAAQERGLPACIYRPARIMGHSKTGITRNFKDYLISMIKACILLEKYPDLETPLYLVPADYAAQALVHLSKQEHAGGKTFHILNPRPVMWKDFFEQIREMGYCLEKVSPEHWHSELAAQAAGNRKNKLFQMLHFVLKSPNALLTPKPEIDAAHTVQGLRETSIVCPPVDRELVFTWISYFQNSGHIPLPVASTPLSDRTAHKQQECKN